MVSQCSRGRFLNQPIQFYLNNTIKLCHLIQRSIAYSAWFGSRVVSVLDSVAEGPGFKSQSRRWRVTVLGKLFTSIVPRSVHQAANLVAALLTVAGVTAGLAESNGSLPALITSPAGWLPRTGISSGTLRSVIEYLLTFFIISCYTHKMAIVDSGTSFHRVYKTRSWECVNGREVHWRSSSTSPVIVCCVRAERGIATEWWVPTSTLPLRCWRTNRSETRPD